MRGVRESESDRGGIGIAFAEQVERAARRRRVGQCDATDRLARHRAGDHVDRLVERYGDLLVQIAAIVRKLAMAVISAVTPFAVGK